MRIHPHPESGHFQPSTKGLVWLLSYMRAKPESRREQALTRDGICWPLDLGSPRLQSFKLSISVVYTVPRLRYFVIAAGTDKIQGNTQKSPAWMNIKRYPWLLAVCPSCCCLDRAVKSAMPSKAETAREGGRDTAQHICKMSTGKINNHGPKWVPRIKCPLKYIVRMTLNKPL